jgi:hypothetical protein
MNSLIARLTEYAEDLRTIHPKSEHADMLCEAIDALNDAEKREVGEKLDIARATIQTLLEDVEGWIRGGEHPGSDNPDDWEIVVDTRAALAKIGKS